MLNQLSYEHKTSEPTNSRRQHSKFHSRVLVTYRVLSYKKERGNEA